MVVIMEYEVLKQHYGDKQYYEGDIRQLDDDFTAKRLIEFGLIGKAHANKKVQSKAKKVPSNKAEPVLENKGDDGDDTEDNA